MKIPNRAGNSPIAIELKEGKTYAWCACGLSKSQPYCDSSHAGSDIVPTVFKAEKNGTHYMCMCKETKNKPFCDGSHL